MTATERRLRIAFVYRYFSRSGSIPSLYVDRAEQLAQDEEVTAVCSSASRVHTDAPLRFETVEPLVRGAGRVKYAIECGSYALRATRRMCVTRNRFDVIHVEGFAALQGDLVTVHAVRPAEIEHYFTRVEPSAWIRRRLIRVARPQTAAVLAIERRLFRQPFPLCIAISAAVGADLQRHYGVPPDLIEVIPYGVDHSVFRRDPLGREEVRRQFGVGPERLVLVFVGDAFERKGLGKVIAALAATHSDAELWVAGGGEFKRYWSAARALGVADRVRYLGRLSRTELSRIYAAADAFLLPSRQDAWGHTVLEAMASGCVVVVSEHTGAHEVVVPGESGFVLGGAGEPAEIAALIDGPLASPETRARIRRAALEASRAFDRDALYRRFRAAHYRAHERRLKLERGRVSGTEPRPAPARPAVGE